MANMRARAEEAVGSEFRQRRRTMGLTQEEVAKAANLSLPTLRKLESGGKVTTTTRRSVASVLGWPVDAYDQLRLGEAPDTLDDVELKPLSVPDGLSLIEVALQRMGVGPVDIEIAMAAVKALVRRPT